MLVDFHIHSTASDGTLPPGEIALRSRFLRAAALTDHDNTGGLAEWPGVKGIELSVEPGDGFDRFHLLGLGIDPGNASLRGLLERIQEGRDERNRRILENFRRAGIEIAPDELSAYAKGKVVARPHIAAWLADRGYVRTRAEAFAVYLEKSSPPATRCYETRYRPPQAEAFAAIHAAGGLCIMAHPKFWRDAWKNSAPDFERAGRELAALKECGLDGIEAFYSANTPQENAKFAGIAERLGYLASAGSDFHGANKPGIELGIDVPERLIAPLLERLG